MKKRTLFILVAVAVAVAFVLALPFLLERALKAGSGPCRVFVLSDTPAFLQEELALSEARETLRLDGLDITQWHVHPDGRTVAPDGRRDEFLGRNGLNSNCGTFMFTSSNALVRFVTVELYSNTVHCQSSVGR